MQWKIIYTRNILQIHYLHRAVIDHHLSAFVSTSTKI